MTAAASFFRAAVREGTELAAATRRFVTERFRDLPDTPENVARIRQAVQRAEPTRPNARNFAVRSGSAAPAATQPLGAMSRSTSAPALPIRREVAATAPRIAEEVYLPPADAADQTLEGEAARAITEFVGHGPATSDRPNFGAGVMQPARLEEAVRGRTGIFADLMRGVEPVRERLAREIPSGTVPLFRHQGPTTYFGETPSSRSVLSWTAQPDVAYYMGGIRPEDYATPFSPLDLARAANPENAPQFNVGPYRFERNADYPEYYDYYKNDEYLTDTEDPVGMLRDENEYIQRLNAERRARAASILHANVPLEDIVWATNRAGQHEFIVRNRPNSPQYVDEFGVFGPKYAIGGRVDPERCFTRHRLSVKR